MNIKSENLLAVAIIALAVGIRLVVHFATGYLVDDAMISFRYAENIAAGNGFVYNIGERVLGTTTPLFTLLLAAFDSIGISISIAATIISLASTAVTSYVLLKFSKAAGIGRFYYLPALLYCLYPRSVVSDISGLETAMFSSLVLLTMYWLHEERYLKAATIGSLAAITRPEGFGFLLLVIAVVAIHKRSSLKQILVPTIPIVGSWAVFSLGYFGNILPTTMAAKMALYQSGSIAALMADFGKMTTLGPVGGVFVLVLSAFTLWLLKLRDRMAIVAITCLAYLIGMAIFVPRIFFWYPAPILPLLFILVAKCIDLLWNMLVHEASPVVNRFAPPIVIGALALIAALTTLGKIDGLSSEMAWYRGNHLAAADYLNQHAQPSDKLLAEDIGHLGSRYRGNIVDRDGLVTPSAIVYNQRQAYEQFVDSVDAHWVFLAWSSSGSGAIRSAPWFGSKYEEVHYVLDAPNRTHLLYRHK